MTLEKSRTDRSPNAPMIHWMKKTVRVVIEKAPTPRAARPLWKNENEAIAESLLPPAQSIRYSNA